LQAQAHGRRLRFSFDEGRPMPRDRDTLPLVYSCSGCSSAAQLANHLALRLDRAGSAEMSCIAGVGGDVPSLVRKAREAVASGRPVVAIDGCALACARHCLARHEVAPTLHVQLGESGVRKAYHADFDAAQAEGLYAGLDAQVRALASGSVRAGNDGGDAGGEARDTGQPALDVPRSTTADALAPARGR
jgi:uncharacterized metal-binding protein